MNNQARGGGNSDCRWAGILIVADHLPRCSSRLFLCEGIARHLTVCLPGSPWSGLRRWVRRNDEEGLSSIWSTRVRHP